jgi:hypothetical protein
MAQKIKVTVRAGSSRVQSFVSGNTGPILRVAQMWREQGRSLVETILRQLVPVKTGVLQNSVTSVETPKGFSVYPTAPYAKYVDKGTNPHVIRARNASVLRWYSVLGDPIFAKWVMHPGSRGKFFMNDARDAARPLLRSLYVDLWMEQ